MVIVNTPVFDVQCSVIVCILESVLVPESQFPS